MHKLKERKILKSEKNDRSFQIGDWLLLKEYNPKIKKFTERKVMVEITYITNYQQKDGYVVLGTKYIKEWVKYEN